MPPETQRLEVTLETLLDSVDLGENIAIRIAGEAGFDDEESHKIGMSVREAVINAFTYGNNKERGKKIGLTFELESEKLVVHVLDEGNSFDLSRVADPLAEENLLRTSGRGIFLMRSFMDEFSVQRGVHGGTEFVLGKWLPGSRNDNGKPQSL